MYFFTSCRKESLNERGLRTRTGKPFMKNSFFQIFRNRRYIGEYRYKDIVTPGGVPAIVDQDLFDRVQQRFEQNRIAHGRPAKEDVSYLLTTKLFCGKCGTLMGGESGTSHMGNTYYYYKCGNAKRHGGALRPESHPQGAAGTVRGGHRH